MSKKAKIALFGFLGPVVLGLALVGLAFIVSQTGCLTSGKGATAGIFGSPYSLEKCKIRSNWSGNVGASLEIKIKGPPANIEAALTSPQGKPWHSRCLKEWDMAFGGGTTVLTFSENDAPMPGKWILTLKNLDTDPEKIVLTKEITISPEQAALYAAAPGSQRSSWR